MFSWIALLGSFGGGMFGAAIGAYAARRGELDDGADISLPLAGLAFGRSGLWRAPSRSCRCSA
jgi:hypothetical protein